MSDAKRKIKGPFFQFYPDDWRGGVRHLSLEARGLYIDLLAAMWERKGGLPDDPRWLSTHIGVDVRVLKRVLPSLISEDKIKRIDGFLSNKRMMVDISRYMRRTGTFGAPQNDAPDDYQNDGFDDAETACDDDTSRGDVPEIPEQMSGRSRTSPADLEKMPLFSLGNHDQEVRSSEYRSLEVRKEEDSPPALEQEPAGGRAGASPEIVILKSIADWTADESRARSWVTAHVGLYGLDVVRDAVAVVVAEIAAGRHVAQPVQLASSVIRRLDAKKPGPGEPRDKPATVPPWAADKSARGRSVDDVLAEFYAEKRARLEAEAAA